MYLDHYGLNREPFHITPDPYFLYLGPSHKESLASLIYGLKNRKGFVSLTGEVGLGKTTVVRAFLNKWSSKAKIKTVFVFNSNLSFRGLLLTIFSELGLQPPAGKQAENGQAASSEQDQIYDLVQTLHRALIQEFEQGYNVILVIDEAQNMPLLTLENLRMLSNLETSRDKLIQIFLIGQTELDSTLDRKELRQLRQRIAIRATLRPLTPKQSKDYILHRLEKAGAPKSREIFTPRALRKICKYSNGVPRKINILADNALITGFGYGQGTIGARIIKEVQRDLQGKTPRRMRSYALASLLLLSMLGIGIWLSPYRPTLLAGLQDFAPWSSPQSSQEQPEKARETPRVLATASETEPKLQSDAHSLPQQVQNIAQQEPGEQNQTEASPADEQNLQAQAKQEEDVQEQLARQNSEQPADPGPSQAEKALPLPQNEQTEENISIHNQLAEKIPVYSDLSPARQLVLIRMAQQISIESVLTFERMLAALERSDFQEAARQMANSRWALSVGEEAEALAEVMRKGEE